MDEQQTNQTTDTTNADTPRQEVASTMPGESSASADTSAAPGATAASSDARASVQSSAPAGLNQQSSDSLGNASAASSSNVADAAPVSPSSAPAAVTGEDPNAGLSPAPHQWTPEQLAQIQAIGSAPIQMEKRFGDALSAAEQFASDTQSSVNTALQSAGTRAINASESLAKEALASLQRLRNHLWTFEHSAVAHLHAEIDKLESFFR